MLPVLEYLLVRPSMPQFNRPETFLAATAASISHRSCIETVAPETYAASQGWRSNHVKPLRKKLTPSRSVKSSGPTKSTKRTPCAGGSIRIHPVSFHVVAKFENDLGNWPSDAIWAYLGGKRK